ncbi:T9SS type A sorting domain-containing protein [Persicobacter diffluens]|uniref:Secretion system C-terminal sorting domain-containing protein n=1 Tax=Persicobacter diffluens TaxID=981 RepID=A0AAN5ANV7_9BACT|nr:hypothetical protein PEDI_37750 [Persicobacter diffluens]
MKAKLFLHFSIILIFCFGGNLSAQDRPSTIWNPAGNANNDGASEASWSNADNWTDGLPAADGIVKFNVKDAITCYVDQNVNIFKFVLGDGGDEADTARLVVKNGGSISTGGEWSGAAWTNDWYTELIVEEGGTINFGNHFWNGWNGKSVVYLRGGDINVNNMYGSAFEPGTVGSGTIYIEKGYLNLGEFHPTQSIPEGSMWNLTGGTIYIKGDHRDNIMNLVNLGRIITTGESGEEVRTLTIDVTGEEGSYLTTITAVSEGPEEPEEPENPENPEEPEGPLASRAESSLTFAVPNPTAGWVEINTKGMDDATSYAVYSLAGRKLTSGLLKGELVKVNLSHYPSGVYIIAVNNAGKFTTQKIMKK